MEKRGFPVNRRRLKNIFKTSFVRYGCLKDVSETACVHWVIVCFFEKGGGWGKHYCFDSQFNSLSNFGDKLFSFLFK